MSESSRNNPFSFDWKSFENIFGGAHAPSSLLPDPSKANQRDTNMNSSWVGDYVERMLKQSHLPKGIIAAPSKAKSAGLDSEIFETQKSVIIKITVPQKVNFNFIRLRIKSAYLRVEGIPDSKHKHTLLLPAPVIAKASRAVLQDGVLEIRMPKDKSEKGYKEVYVHFK